MVFVGVAAVAMLALFSAARPADASTAVAAPASASLGPQLVQTASSVSGNGGHVITVDDNTNPSSGDIFTQNAQDQSTA
jgi:hypothetical protein